MCTVLLTPPVHSAQGEGDSVRFHAGTVAALGKASKVAAQLAAEVENVEALVERLNSSERERSTLKTKLVQEQRKNADLESKLAQVAGKLRGCLDEMGTNT